MYEKAEEGINNGLSPFARFLLGFFSALFGIVMFLGAPSNDKTIYFYAFAIFCMLIALACILKGRARQFVGSVIGSALFGLSGWYLFSELESKIYFSGKRSEPSVVNAIFFFLAFGLPGIRYAIKARFGRTSNESAQTS